MKNNFTMTIAAILLLTSFNLSAMEITNCDKTEIDKDYHYFCLLNEDGIYYVKESLSLLREQKSDNRRKTSMQIYRIQEIENIKDHIFKTNLKMENQNGLITIIDENNSLYTLRSGYIQDNDHYLEIRNNKLDSITKENIEKVKKVKKVKKVSSYYEMYALNYDNELWNIKDDVWKKVNIGTVYDFVYLEDGRVYALTDKGLYKKKPIFKKNKLSTKDLIVDDFILMDLKIDESLYLEKIEFEKYKKHIFDLLFNKDSKLGMLRDELEPYFKDKRSDEYVIEISSKTIDIIDYKNRGYDRASTHYRNPVKEDIEKHSE